MHVVLSECVCLVHASLEFDPGPRFGCLSREDQGEGLGRKGGAIIID